MKANSILLGELFSAAVQVNEATNKSVFVYLNGHIKTVDFRIAKSKREGDMKGGLPEYGQHEVEITIKEGESEEKILAAITYLQAMLPKESFHVDLIHRSGGAHEDIHHPFDQG